MLLYMKLTIVLLTAVFLNVSASGISQNISFSGKNIPLAKIFEQIKAQTGYAVLYTGSSLEGTKPVSIEVKNMPLEKFLQLILKEQPFKYSLSYKTVLLSRKEVATPSNLQSGINTSLQPLKGNVSDSLGNPLIGATIVNRTTKKTTSSALDGSFTINASEGDILLVSFIGYETRSIVVASSFLNNANVLAIILKASISALADITVTVSTGYQQIPRERATGSFGFVNNELLNKRVSTDILSRLEGNVPGLIFNRNTSKSSTGIDVSIRGYSTLFANNQPLIIVDNFPYDGDINNINPNDIESVTILKDAAAASIWGARSGNGVIVIVTKKGKQSQRLNTEINANLTFGNKPDLYYNPNFLNSNDFIDVEKTLFNQGYYTTSFTNSTFPVISPVVQILYKQQLGQITAPDATAQIDALRSNDVRDDMSEYFYQQSINQQYAVNLKGGGVNNDYFFSLGYDKNRANLVGNKNNRLTLNAVNNFSILKKLQLTTVINYTQSVLFSNSQANNINGGGLKGATIYPYADLVDANGQALPIVQDISSIYKDTAGAGKFLDWKFRPYEELSNADNRNKSNAARLSLGVKYTFFKGLNAQINYYYENAHSTTTNYYSLLTYYARNLINRFTTINSGGVVSYAIPKNGILNQFNNSLNANRLRGQLNYSNNWLAKHDVTAIVGAEINEVVNQNNSTTTYGYNKDNETYQNVDLVSYFPTNPGSTSQIPSAQSRGKFIDRYISYYSNAAYTYNNLYTISLSGRIDKSNLFGVDINQKSIPLYSTGFAWNLSGEKFYHISWLPYAKLRATYGYNGNVNKSVAAYTTTIQIAGSTNPYTGLPFSIVANAGNPELRWEKIRIINMGIDFASARQIITGSIEYYSKKGIDLFGDSPLPPSTGLSIFRGNVANIKGNGFDIVLNTRNIDSRSVKWTTNFLLSHALDKVTKYEVKQSTATYLSFGSGNAGTITPLTGKPIFSIYSYKWAGLNPNTGNPQGYLNKQVSTDYAKIISTSTMDSLVFNGSARPTYFGSLRNTFSYKGLSLSLNIIYKFDYYFRRSSIDYPSLFQSWIGHKDFEQRWRNPGDEKTTNIPSIVYSSVDANRAFFYMYSDALVEKGDHIRLQDIALSYDLNETILKKLGFIGLQLYGNVNNVGIIWRSNKQGLDPDIFTQGSLSGYPNPRTISVGIKANF